MNSAAGHFGAVGLCGSVKGRCSSSFVLSLYQGMDLVGPSVTLCLSLLQSVQTLSLSHCTSLISVATPYGGAFSRPLHLVLLVAQPDQWAF